MTDDAIDIGRVSADAESEGSRKYARRSSVTMKEVAARANVSPTTASLFFKGREDVCSEATAARLLQAAADLNYPINRPRRNAIGDFETAAIGAGMHALAQAGQPAPTSLPVPDGAEEFTTNARTYVLGVCIPRDSVPDAFTPTRKLRSYPNTFLEQVWRGISHVADGEYYRILQYPRSVREGEAIEPFLQESQIDGLIMLASSTDPRPGRIAAAGVPVVLVERKTGIPPGCGAVFALESNTIELALSHLWQLKHRQIAHFGAPEANDGGDAAGQIAKRRLDRYSTWMQVRNVFMPELIFRITDWNTFEEEITVALDRMGAMPDPPTAVFCGNDAIAVAACHAAEALGLRVPEDISIVGVDNSVYGAENSPSITSIEIPYEQVGNQAVVQLTRMLEGASAAASRTAIAVTNLVVRESTAPARAS